MKEKVSFHGLKIIIFNVQKDGSGKTALLLGSNRERAVVPGGWSTGLVPVSQVQVRMGTSVPLF